MSLEETLAGWTGPSSATEQDKQDRTLRMVSDAIKSHAPFDGVWLNVFAKGSYPNNTNVRADSDVDIAVECCECVYNDGEIPAGATGSPYQGVWTPSKLRSEVERALGAGFPTGQVDATGTTAIGVHASSARVDADVVPCFSYRYWLSNGSHRPGTKVFRKNGSSLVNYPQQQLDNGRAKNTATNGYFKKTVRVLKRVENAMVLDGRHREVPSFLVECLVYNVANSRLAPYGTFLSWEQRVRNILVDIWEATQGDAEPAASARWREVNECKYLFSAAQKWSRADGRDFAKAGWNYLGLGS